MSMAKCGQKDRINYSFGQTGKASSSDIKMAGVKVCQKCGTSNELSSKFCSNCGENLNSK